MYTADLSSPRPKTFSEVVVNSPAITKPKIVAGSQFYSLSLKIFYETIPGESICVVGSIPELGTWKELKCHMTWTEGHIWVIDKPIVTNQPFFSYKYVLMDNDKKDMVKWEAGIDRIAELRLLPEITAPVRKIVQGGTGSSDLFMQKMDLKHVELYDEWETFMVRFTIFYPLD